MSAQRDSETRSWQDKLSDLDPGEVGQAVGQRLEAWRKEVDSLQEKAREGDDAARVAAGNQLAALEASIDHARKELDDLDPEAEPAQDLIEGLADSLDRIEDGLRDTRIELQAPSST